ncbi:arsenical pump-driving ATPase [soil metagenome]
MIRLARDTLADLPTHDFGAVDTPFVFFTGKGGVGKTSVASATALRLADAGRRVLIVSTDPASNLDDVFDMRVGTEPTPVAGVNGLDVMNIDPEAAAAAYREQMVGPYRGVLPDTAVRSMEEQLSGACTVEIAAFNEFTALLAQQQIVERYDHILFDTAPTGHTLRLLSLPSAWSEFIDTGSAGASCLGPLAGLEAHQAQYAATVRALADATRTTVNLVSRAEESALREAARAGGELALLGIANQRLILNGVFMDATGGDVIAEAIAHRQGDALRGRADALCDIPTTIVPLVSTDLTGIAALRALASAHVDDMPPTMIPLSADERRVEHAGLGELVSALEVSGHGVVMTMGKGGVGKTALASAIAVALADRGHSVHLTTTDPAAHLLDALGDDRPSGLTVSRIDPVVETQSYAEEVIAAAGALDDEGRAMLEEDLRSPCTEEIAVFRAFAREVDAAQEGFVVLDTAPTGHTLLLLDAAESYHREVGRSNGAVPDAVRSLLPRLRDPAYTRMLLITLAQATPVHEASRLQDDLRRAGIEPYGWIVNASLAASGTTHPLLAERAHLELAHLRRVASELAVRTWVVPWQARPLVGAEALLALTNGAVLQGASAPDGVPGRSQAEGKT